MSSPSAVRALAPRSVPVAVLFSLLAAGLGHLYVGRGRRGVALLALTLTYVPVVFLLSRLEAGPGVLTGLACVVAFQTGLLLFGMFDAWRLARAAARPYAARAYNSTGLYLLLVMLSFGLSLLGTGWLIANAFQAFVIPSKSMAPTIQYGDRLLVNKGPLWTRRGDGAVPRGAVIVFRAPDGSARNYIKRIVGLPGETVEIGPRDGSVRIDGTPLPREAIEGQSGMQRERAGTRSYTITEASRGEGAGRYEVPTGHVFVLGDNRDASRDSRSFGPVAIGSILGVAEYRIWSTGGTSRLGPLP